MPAASWEMVRQLLHGEYLQSSREKLLSDRAARVPLSLPVSVLFLPREDWGVEGGTALPAGAGLVPVQPLCSSSSSRGKAAAVQCSSALSGGCLPKELWAGEWCHRDRLLHTVWVPPGTSAGNPLGQEQHSPYFVTTVLSKICRNAQQFLHYFQCSTL